MNQTENLRFLLAEQNFNPDSLRNRGSGVFTAVYRITKQDRYYTGPKPADSIRESYVQSIDDMPFIRSIGRARYYSKRGYVTLRLYVDPDSLEF